MTAATTRRIEALTHLTSMTVTALVAELPEPVRANLDGVEPSDVPPPVAAARRVRAAAGLVGGPVADVVALVESLGVAIVRRSLSTEAQDAVSLRLPDRHPVIIVNTALPGDRQRFTVAHELGHLILHGWEVAAADDDIEAEANMFAAELLAPAEAMSEELAGLSARDFRRLLEIKHRWGISISALIERAKNLHLVDIALHKTLRIRLNQYGWNQVEPGEVPDEAPWLVAGVIDRHLDQLARTTENVASTALMLPEPFVKHYMGHRRPEGSALEVSA